MKAKNLVGQTFGRWTVVSRAPNNKHNLSQWVCKCECDTLRLVTTSNLIFGSSTSCGCYRKELLTKHGHAKGCLRTPTYDAWICMHQRCTNPKNPGYEFWGGRGISVCERWSSFENFLEDMGERPPGMSIDRFPDQNGNYEKSNCRWATSAQQNRNTRRNHIVAFNGETHCLTDWAEILGILPSTLFGRLATGWSIERAFTTKPRAHVRHSKPTDDG